VSKAIPIAFYAPLKSPHQPAPSGDRTMARLLMAALQEAGFAPELASELRSFEGRGAPERQSRLREEAEREADALIARHGASPAGTRPRLWFTYHVYYKAPDWIGPRVADALGMPYVVAEGSRAGKRAQGPWSVGHAGAEAALDRADAVFVMTPIDRKALEGAKPAHQRLIDLPPFIDVMGWQGQAPDRKRDAAAAPRLLTVAMMRAGDKLASYTILSHALSMLAGHAWEIDIVGDGPVRAEVEGLFAPFGGRVRFHGGIEDRARLAGLYAAADLFVWPAVNEAYGMVFLEAQALGCPVIAGACGGVASVVRDGETGLLAAPGDAAAFASSVAALLDDPARRQKLGIAAADFVRTGRALQHAAERLRAGMMPLIEGTIP
jgi:glycosyltransferase involved in cell wall biosynthesis